MADPKLCTCRSCLNRKQQHDNAVATVFAQARWSLYKRGFPCTRVTLTTESNNERYLLLIISGELSSFCLLPDDVLQDHQVLLALGEKLADGLVLDELATLEVG